METVKFRTLDYAQLVKRLWGEEWNKPDVAYEFSDGRKFEDSGAHSGIYDVPAE